MNIDQNRHNKDIGDMGERIVYNHYLKNKRCIIKNTNVYFKGGEIDIIAEKSNTLIFVEVKTVKEGCVEAVDNFTSKKAKNFKRAIDLYLYKNNIKDKDLRVDLAFVTLKDTFFNKKQPERSDFDLQIFENVILE